MTTLPLEPTEQYQKNYLEKERLYNEYRAGNLGIEELSKRVNELDHSGPKYAKYVRIMIGLFLPLLFIRPSR